MSERAHVLGVRLVIFASLVVTAGACSQRPAVEPIASEPLPTPAIRVVPPTAVRSPAPARRVDSAERAAERERMVHTQIEDRGIRDPRVLAAMRRVPRHLFVPESERTWAYGDHPLPIGYDQTISQPYIVALMSQLAEVSPGERVLEIGTGSGYQAAVLAEMGATVYSIEIVEPLARSSAALLERLGYASVHVRAGDGYRGWPEHAPFDAIVVTAAPPRMPQPLLDQVRIGGKIVAPVGEGVQDLVVLTRHQNGFQRVVSEPVAFVPMTGEAQRRR